MLDKVAEAAREAERKFGLPPLSKFIETVEKLPDEKRLKLIKEVLVAAEKLSQTAPQLDQVVSLIRELKSVPVEQLETWLKLLRKIEAIMKKAPQELLSFLTSLREK